MLLVCSVVFLVVVGARTCRPIYNLTDAQREQMRLDIFTMCEINKCSAAKLAGLLQQLDSWPLPEAEEEKQQ